MTPNSSELVWAALNTRPSASGTVQPFQAGSGVLRLPRLTAYIDETGDRGPLKGNASPIFGMAAVIVDNGAERAARGALQRLRSDLGTPADRPLSWKKDLKKHDRRTHAAKIMSAVPGLRVVYVLVDKARLPAGSYGDDVTLLYNVIAYETLRRVLWTAKRWPGGRSGIDVRYGHVAHHDHLDTHRYFQIKKGQDPRFAYELITSLTWVNASQYEMSQVADVYGGFLKAAFWPNDFGDVEGGYLTRVWHQIRNSEDCVLTLGLQPRPDSTWAKGMEWWPCSDCRSKY